MIVTHYQYSAESMLDNKAFEEGALYFIEDTGNIYLDPIGGSERINIANNLIFLTTESARTNLLSPIPGKIYFVVESCTNYIYYNNVWYACGITKSYVDNSIASAKTNMADYTDKNIDSAKTTLTNYIDNRVNNIDTGATEEYVDQKIAGLDTGASTQYVDNAVSNLDSDMREYVNQQIANVDSGVSEEYVNQAIQDATENINVDVPTLQEHFSNENMILSGLQYGTSLPSTGVEGQVFFLIVT